MKCSYIKKKVLGKRNVRFEKKKQASNFIFCSNKVLLSFDSPLKWLLPFFSGQSYQPGGLCGVILPAQYGQGI